MPPRISWPPLWKIYATTFLQEWLLGMREKNVFWKLFHNIQHGIFSWWVISAGGFDVCFFASSNQADALGMDKNKLKQDAHVFYYKTCLWKGNVCTWSNIIFLMNLWFLLKAIVCMRTNFGYRVKKVYLDISYSHEPWIMYRKQGFYRQRSPWIRNHTIIQFLAQLKMVPCLLSFSQYLKKLYRTR